MKGARQKDGGECTIVLMQDIHHTRAATTALACTLVLACTTDLVYLRQGSWEGHLSLCVETCPRGRGASCYARLVRTRMYTIALPGRMHLCHELRRGVYRAGPTPTCWSSISSQKS